MKVKAASPIRELSGTYEGCDVVFSTVRGRILARGRTEPANPRSADQLLIRNFMSIATKNWDTLSPAQREAWQAYAEAWFTKNEAGEDIEPSGLAAYTRANVIRQVLGLSLLTAAPVEGPPAPVSAVAQTTGLNPDVLGLTVTHGYTTVTGLQVLVRATPPMRTVAREPRPELHRYVRGVGPASAVALPATGGAATFTPIRFPVEDGQRYGVEVRVVRTADGLLSRPVYGDFIKIV